MLSNVQTIDSFIINEKNNIVMRLVHDKPFQQAASALTILFFVNLGIATYLPQKLSSTVNPLLFLLLPLAAVLVWISELLFRKIDGHTIKTLNKEEMKDVDHVTATSATMQGAAFGVTLWILLNSTYQLNTIVPWPINGFIAVSLVYTAYKLTRIVLTQVLPDYPQSLFDEVQ